MVGISTQFIQEKNKETNKPIYLYTIYDYIDTGENYNITESDRDITFDGVLYRKFPVSHSDIGDNSKGQTPSVKVKLSNVSRAIQYYVENFEWRDKKVLIRLVWLDRLDDVDNKFDFIYYIDKYFISGQVAEFTLLPKVDALGVILPKRVYSRNYCGWHFKSIECGYAGVETECNKTMQRCRELDNVIRYGGFPAIPSKTLYV